MISKVREVTIEIEISMVTDTHLRVSRTNLLFITKIFFLVEEVYAFVGSFCK